VHRYLFGLLSALALLLAACAPAVQTEVGSPALEPFANPPIPFERRWIIAVPDFNVRSGSVKVGASELERRDQALVKELGTGVADIFLNEAFRSQQFRITERAELGVILREQDLAATGRIDPHTAADVGRITGAELIVLGSLTEFGVTSTGGGGIVFGLFGGTAETVTARVTVDVRVVNSVTAEILAIGTATSEVSQSNVQIDVLNIIRALGAGRTGTTIVDIAVRNAIIGAINEIAADLPSKR